MSAGFAPYRSEGAIDRQAYPILFVDDEPDIVETFEIGYGREFRVLTATTGQEALAILGREPVAVLVTDQRMPQMQGIELIRRALELRADLVPIILTGYTDVETLIDAINLGRIYRYIPKPWDTRELRMTLVRALEVFSLARENQCLAEENGRLVAELRQVNERLARENGYLKRRDARGGGFEGLVGRGAAMRHVLSLAQRVADSTVTVLLEGSTGTGKDLLARAIHDEGPRRERLFVAQNCGELTETLLGSELFGHRKGAFTGAIADKKGLFEVADGGTLFLDEIGETSPAVQIHLLRALQEREIRPIGALRPVSVDVRLIAATNRDLAADVRAGRFREDLYFRLRVFRICMPTLDDRREDIPALVEHALAKHAAALKRPVEGLTDEALAALMRYGFRGNVRELENMLLRAVLLAEPGVQITEAELFEEADDGAPGDRGGTLEDSLGSFERELLVRTLEQCQGNKTHAARRLGLTYRGLLKKLQRLGLVPLTAARNA